MTEEERVREEAIEILNRELHGDCRKDCAEEYDTCNECLAAQILSIKVYGEVTIKDLIERGLLKCENQELPEITAPVLGIIGRRPYGYEIQQAKPIQQDMHTPKDGTVWVKCLERREK